MGTLDTLLDALTTAAETGHGYVPARRAVVEYFTAIRRSAGALAPQEDVLPELPRPVADFGGNYGYLYTADDMRNYARAAVRLDKK